MTTSNIALIILVVGYMVWVWGVVAIGHSFHTRKDRKKRQEKAFFDLLHTRDAGLSKGNIGFRHKLALNDVARAFSVENFEIYAALAFYIEHLDTKEPSFLEIDGIKMNQAGRLVHKELLTDLLEALAKHVKFNISRENIADGIERLKGNVVRRPEEESNDRP